ncbi:YafY family transcriptional regulator [Nocardioides jishulii]|uniref:YafY family transcriptional regulator n=2 Tax=Nocardioides jishulii TaxID=2575440 RepID=A0A4V5TKS3_9ACTN|nr:YafY family transcriptional regulator [Nocardioides jishulii]TKI64843.1 YafY family transcriptional regulator [Nocardioides jishulii]
MLRLLSLLQTHRYWPGGELADRLEVSARTLRRDVERLRDLGYQVDAVRGVAGGYQLRAGGAMAPLLLTDEEAVAVAVALRGAAGTAAGVGGGPDWALQALTKVVGLMPPLLRRQMDAVRSQTDTPAPWSGAPVLDAAVLSALAQACRDTEPLRFDYAARDAEPSHRWVEPHRLVALGRRWYLVAYDRDRQDWRTFRVDRVTAPEPTGQRFRPRDLPGGDAVEFVRAGIRRAQPHHEVRVTIEAPVDEVVAAVGRWGRVTPEGVGCRLEMEVDSLGWPLMVLGEVGADFHVESPPELADAVAEVAARFARAAG